MAFTEAIVLTVAPSSWKVKFYPLRDLVELIASTRASFRRSNSCSGMIVVLGVECCLQYLLYDRFRQ